MIKKKLLVCFLFTNIYAYSQVGINTNTPNATLDVVANPTDITSMDGIIAPRLTGDELSKKTYTIDQKGAMVYVTTPASTLQRQVINVKQEGLYYFNGNIWVTGIPNNIYNIDGTLTSTRVLNQDNKLLTFQNSQRTVFNNSLGIGIQQDSGIGSRASIGLSNERNTHLWIYTDTNSNAQIYATGNSTGLQIGTSSTVNPTPIRFATSVGNGATSNVRAEISGDGRFIITNNLSIGYANAQTFTGSEKLKINGSIVTTGNTYPDYVFEKYFDNKSTIQPIYKFNSLYDTEKFIVENRHLPGVTPISKLEKTQDGYLFNITDLSVQSLEKIEELYLHTIEQQKQIDEQKNQIESLLKRTEYLESKLINSI